MSRTAYGLCIYFLLYIGKVQCLTVQQNPTSMLANKNKIVVIKCSHDDNNMDYMQWYQQKDTAMALIVFSYGATSVPVYEDAFKDQFKLERTDTFNGVLKISDLSLSDSAVYYCAVSMHSAVVFITCLTKNQTTRQTGNAIYKRGI